MPWDWLRHGVLYFPLRICLHLSVWCCTMSFGILLVHPLHKLVELNQKDLEQQTRRFLREADNLTSVVVAMASFFCPWNFTKGERQKTESSSTFFKMYQNANTAIVYCFLLEIYQIFVDWQRCFVGSIWSRTCWNVSSLDGIPNTSRFKFYF